MATHETEITEAVDLCTPDGKHLNPAAVGWSRVPLHRANLRGWGRTKRWDYWGILLGDATVSLTFADVDFAGLVAFYWADFTTGEQVQVAPIVPPVNEGRVPRRVIRELTQQLETDLQVVFDRAQEIAG